MHSVQFPFSAQTQTSKWKSSPSAIFLSYSNEWIWCCCQGSKGKIYKLFPRFLGVCYFCSRSGLIRWALDKMSRRKAKLMRKSFEELGWGFRPWLGSCIGTLAHAWARLLSWDGLAGLPWPPLAWPQLAPAQHSCSSPLAKALEGWNSSSPAPAPAHHPDLLLPENLKWLPHLGFHLHNSLKKINIFKWRCFFPFHLKNLSYYNIFLVVSLDQEAEIKSGVFTSVTW